MGKIKAIVKRAGEKYGHVCHISDSMENLQRTVGGHVQCIEFEDFCILCNEDGKAKGLPFNMYIGMDTLVGTIIIVGNCKDYFGDLVMDFSIWKRLVDRWGK